MTLMTNDLNDHEQNTEPRMLALTQKKYNLTETINTIYGYRENYKRLKGTERSVYKALCPKIG